MIAKLLREALISLDIPMGAFDENANVYNFCNEQNAEACLGEIRNPRA